jgi:hypothetical protein
MMWPYPLEQAERRRKAMYRIYYTASLQEPDDTDTDAYGEPCLLGHGYTERSGWWSPDWTRWEVYDSKDDVSPDTYDASDERSPVQWAAEIIMERLGYVQGIDGGETFYGVDSGQNYESGVTIIPDAHLYGFSETECAMVGQIILSAQF